MTEIDPYVRIGLRVWLVKHIQHSDFTQKLTCSIAFSDMHDLVTVHMQELESLNYPDVGTHPCSIASMHFGMRELCGCVTACGNGDPVNAWTVEWDPLILHALN